MLTKRGAQERGHANHGWLDSFHTFSFADYHDPRHMGFGPLRVINEDRIVGGAGFPAHGHADMEIISYVLDGAIEHKDSMGTGSVIRPGDVQRMSAGRGVVHSEFNASGSEPAHFLQIWIIPRTRGTTPRYDQRHFSDEDKRGHLRLLASPDGTDGSVEIDQDVRLYAARLEAGVTAKHAFVPGRRGWLQIARGRATVNGTPLETGDAVAITDEAELALTGEAAEVLLFDLPGRAA
jgi:redox-sensitive bicupin YhaK (pirin superfamily)